MQTVKRLHSWFELLKEPIKMTRTLKQQPKYTLNIYFYPKYNNLGETRTHLPLFQIHFNTEGAGLQL